MKCIIIVLVGIMVFVLAAQAKYVPDPLSAGSLIKRNGTVEEITFIKDDPDCNGVCNDNEPHPICVQLKSDRRVIKDVFNMCILERVNCHYKDAYVKIHDTACP